MASDLTVVITSLGREILQDTLASIGRGNLLPAKVVLVHQGDDPRVREWAAGTPDSLNVEYVPSTLRGISAGRNTGIDRVETRFVVMTDDDCLVDPQWVGNLVARLRSQPDRLVTGRAEPVGDETVIATSREFDVQHRPRLTSDLLGGFNMAGSLEVLRHIGPFDEDPCIGAADDVEYAYRALRAGVSITYDPDIVIGHVGWRDDTNRENQYSRNARSLAGFYGKYLRSGDAFIALRIVVHLLKCSRRWLVGVLRGDADTAANGRAYLRWFLPGFMEGWRAGG